MKELRDAASHFGEKGSQDRAPARLIPYPVAIPQNDGLGRGRPTVGPGTANLGHEKGRLRRHPRIIVAIQDRRHDKASTSRPKATRPKSLCSQYLRSSKSSGIYTRCRSPTGPAIHCHRWPTLPSILPSPLSLTPSRKARTPLPISSPSLPMRPMPKTSITITRIMTHSHPPRFGILFSPMSSMLGTINNAPANVTKHYNMRGKGRNSGQFFRIGRLLDLWHGDKLNPNVPGSLPQVAAGAFRRGRRSRTRYSNAAKRRCRRPNWSRLPVLWTTGNGKDNPCSTVGQSRKLP